MEKIIVVYTKDYRGDYCGMQKMHDVCNVRWNDDMGLLKI